MDINFPSANRSTLHNTPFTEKKNCTQVCSLQFFIALPDFVARERDGVQR